MNDNASRIFASGDVIQIARYLARDLDDSAKEEVLLSLKNRLLDASLGSEKEQFSWLKKLCCETPLIDTDLSADEVIRLFTLLLTRLYPKIHGHFSQNMRFTFLTDVELVIKQMPVFITLAQLQHNMLLRLQGIALSRLGYELIFTKNHEAAREKLNAAQAIIESICLEEPDNTKFMQTLSSVYENLGILEQDVSFSNAREWFVKSNEIRKQLVGIEPENPHFIDMLSDSYIFMGDIEEMSALDQSGHMSDEFYWKSYLLCKKLVAINPENDEFHRSLSIAYERIGNRRIGTSPAKARQWFLKAYNIRKKQFQYERDSRSKIDTFWVCCNKLGQVHSTMGNMQMACSWFQEGLELAERLYSMDQKNIRYNGMLAIACLRLAEEMEKNCQPNARELFLRSQEITDGWIREGLCSFDYYNLAIQALEGLERIDSVVSIFGSTEKWSKRKEEIRIMLEELNG